MYPTSNFSMFDFCRRHQRRSQHQVVWGGQYGDGGHSLPVELLPFRCRPVQVFPYVSLSWSWRDLGLTFVARVSTFKPE